MDIGIIGAGMIGGTLARRLTALDHEVVVANSAAREKVMRLVDELGFDPVDAGHLEDSWRQQPGTPCYVADLDAPRLKAALAAADQDRVPEYRSKADEAARAFFASRLQPQ